MPNTATFTPAMCEYRLSATVSHPVPPARHLGAPPPLSATTMYVATPIPTSASRTAAMRRVRSVGMRQCYEAHVNNSERAAEIRPAELSNAARIAEIFNQGVEDRVATFETRLAKPADAARWIDGDLVLVAVRDDAILGWAKAGS